MKSTGIAKEVEALQMQKSPVEQKLDTLIQRFQFELPSIAETWMRREVERRIEDHPDVLEKLGTDKLKALKDTVNDLIASLPEIVKKETSDESDWPHNRAPESSGYERDKNEPFFNESFRNVISYLGVVLDEFGLLSELKVCVPSWERVGTGGCIPRWERLGPGRFRYTTNPGFEALSTPSVKEFGEVYNRYRALSGKLDNKQKELAKAKARELWEFA
jgi:hypothetical protein